MNAPMTLAAALVRLQQYGERTSTWSTATYNDGTEKALHEIALTLAAEVDKLSDELAGANLTHWEDEQDAARLRLALKSAQRGRRELRARVAKVKRWRERTEEAETAEAQLRGQVRELRPHITELESQVEKVAAFCAARAEYVTSILNCHPDNAHDYYRWQGHAESRRQLSEQLGLPVAWPAKTESPNVTSPDPLVVSRFDTAIEPAPEEEQILTVGCIAEDGRPVALLLDAETRAKVAEWLAPSVQLTAYEQLFLTFALELAADQIALRPAEFDAADNEALASLRRLTGGAA